MYIQLHPKYLVLQTKACVVKVDYAVLRNPAVPCCISYPARGAYLAPFLYRAKSEEALPVPVITDPYQSTKGLAETSTSRAYIPPSLHSSVRWEAVIIFLYGHDTGQVRSTLIIFANLISLFAAYSQPHSLSYRTILSIALPRRPSKYSRRGKVCLALLLQRLPNHDRRPTLGNGYYLTYDLRCQWHICTTMRYPI